MRVSLCRRHHEGMCSMKQCSILGSVGELYTRLAYIITRTEPYAAKPLNINFSGFAGLFS
jgi:hypothetical protein